MCQELECRNRMHYLITMAEHGSKNILQQGKHMFIGLKQAAHSLQFYDISIRPLCNWGVEKKENVMKLNPELFMNVYPYFT